MHNKRKKEVTKSLRFNIDKNQYHHVCYYNHCHLNDCPLHKQKYSIMTVITCYVVVYIVVYIILKYCY